MEDTSRTRKAAGADRSHQTRSFYLASAHRATFADYGIDIPTNGHGEVRAVCPRCAPDHHRRSKTLSINTDKAVWCCHRCGWAGALRGGERPVAMPPPRIESPSTQEKRLTKLRTLWKAAVPLDHAEAEPARIYLRVRGLGEALSDPPVDLRLHPTLAYWDQDGGGQWHKVGRFPAYWPWCVTATGSPCRCTVLT